MEVNRGAGNRVAQISVTATVMAVVVRLVVVITVAARAAIVIHIVGNAANVERDAHEMATADMRATMRVMMVDPGIRTLEIMGAEMAAGAMETAAVITAIPAEVVGMEIAETIKDETITGTISRDEKHGVMDVKILTGARGTGEMTRGGSPNGVMQIMQSEKMERFV